MDFAGGCRSGFRWMGGGYRRVAGRLGGAQKRFPVDGGRLQTGCRAVGGRTEAVSGGCGAVTDRLQGGWGAHRNGFRWMGGGYRRVAGRLGGSQKRFPGQPVKPNSESSGVSGMGRSPVPPPSTAALGQGVDALLGPGTPAFRVCLTLRWYCVLICVFFFYFLHFFGRWAIACSRPAARPLSRYQLHSPCSKVQHALATCSMSPGPYLWPLFKCVPCHVQPLPCTPPPFCCGDGRFIRVTAYRVLQGTEGTFAWHLVRPASKSMFRPAIPMRYPRHTEFRVPFSQLQKHESFIMIGRSDGEGV